MAYSIKRSNWLLKWAFLYEQENAIFCNSICALVWRTLIFTPIKLIATLIVIAWSPAIALLFLVGYLITNYGHYISGAFRNIGEKLCPKIKVVD